MPGYVENALQHFNHPKPTRAQDAPHTYNKPTYAAPQQLTAPPDTTAPLSKSEITRLVDIPRTSLSDDKIYRNKVSYCND
jgi:hypothetical protein